MPDTDFRYMYNTCGSPGEKSIPLRNATALLCSKRCSVKFPLRAGFIYAAKT